MDKATELMHPMPSREMIRLWVDALVSGDYRQGRQRLLSRVGGYCCMGVAAAICPLPMEKGVTPDFITFDGERNWLPYQVQLWLGLASQSPPIARWEWLSADEQEQVAAAGHEGVDLAAHTANDLLLWSLEKIGRSIERYYLSDEAVVVAQ